MDFGNSDWGRHGIGEGNDETSRIIKNGLTNIEILNKHSDKLMRLYIIGYDRVRRDNKRHVVSESEFNAALDPRINEHPVYVLPTRESIDSNRKSIVKNMKVLVNHNRQYECGIVCDYNLTNAGSIDPSKYLAMNMMLGLWYSKIPELLRLVGAPQSLINRVRHWKGTEFDSTTPSEHENEIQVKRWFVGRLSASLAYTVKVNRLNAMTDEGENRVEVYGYLMDEVCSFPLQ